MITNPEDWRVATCESSRSHRSERELEAMGNLSKQGPDAENQAPSWTPQSRYNHDCQRKVPTVRQNLQLSCPSAAGKGRLGLMETGGLYI